LKAVIIGAGATGLSLAYILSLNSVEVTVLEAGAEAGGLLATFDAGGGHRLEKFYHHFFTHDAEIHWLLGELGLREVVEYRPTTMGLFRDGRIYPFNGPRDLLGLDCLSVAGRVRFGLSSALLAYLPGYCEREDEAAMEWFRRWAGGSATGAIWEPMLRVKFGDAAERIPLAWMAGRMRQRVRSRSGTQEKLGYLRGSMQVLVDGLVEELRRRGVSIRLGAKVESLDLGAEGCTGVRVSGETIAADAVISTVPTPVLARLVQDTRPQYAAVLSEIRYMGALCSVLSVERRLSPVYWLNVAADGYDFGGVIEQTNFVPAEHYGGRHIVYLSRYLDVNHPLWRRSDREVLERQLGQLNAVFSMNVRDHLRKSWVFRGRYAAPVCDLGFAGRIPKFRSPVENLYVASMCHVYPDERSVNNSVRVAAEVAAAMGLDASMVPHGFSSAAKYGT
jgi:protoporphyrinogen oxidase